ncbi:MAG: nucleotidyltransferase domain-containing protein [Candidatus Margulisiibacteriota bacterium]
MLEFPRIKINEKSLISLAQKYQITELMLFGSVLRDDFSLQSDIDVLISFSPEVHYSYFDLLAIRDAFEKKLQHPVDLVERSSLRNPFRREKILSTAFPVYAT